MVLGNHAIPHFWQLRAPYAQVASGHTLGQAGPAQNAGGADTAAQTLLPTPPSRVRTGSCNPATSGLSSGHRDCGDAS